MLIVMWFGTINRMYQAQCYGPFLDPNTPVAWAAAKAQPANSVGRFYVLPLFAPPAGVATPPFTPGRAMDGDFLALQLNMDLSPNYRIFGGFATRAAAVAFLAAQPARFIGDAVVLNTVTPV